MFIVQLAALLHDIADWKFSKRDFMARPKEASEFLNRLNVNSKTIKHICDIIQKLSFKGAKTHKKI